MTRPDWDKYFFDMAALVSTRGTCDKLQVGCVIVRNNRVLCTGYNGSLPGEDHCEDVGHNLKNNHCTRAVHAEANAICQAAKDGISIMGATAYVTHRPCINCDKLLRATGVDAIKWNGEYKDDRR